MASAVTSLLTGRQIIGEAETAGVSAALVTYLGKTPKSNDVLYCYSIGLNTLVPSANPKVTRILTGADVEGVPRIMTAALRSVP